MKHVGTKLEKRLARGDKGVNGLDELCKEHDIAYAKHQDSAERYKADKKLSSGAIKRVFSKDATWGERGASLLVTAAMKAKTGLSKFGMGVCLSKKKKSSRAKKTKNAKKSQKLKKTISFNALVQDAKRGIDKTNANTVGTAIKAALRSAKKYAKGKQVKVPRIIKVPSITGGILPVLPILAGLGAIGSLVGTATNIYKTAKDVKDSTARLEEYKRHNLAIEKKIGSGLYLGINKKGKGLYLRPYRRSNSKNVH